MELGRSSVTAESQRFVEDMLRVTVNYKWGGAVVARY